MRRRTARRQGARLRERRAAYLALRTSGMKQAAAAARVGISVKTAYRYEHDEGGRP
ncbi:helix-turn-helix domain-containing protein [Nocardiopsis composta]